ncbi:MAG: hypothetical protein KDA79_14600, partial [Planctomycetaceae bacterium]|nr:hypothetical protein [Planctomycetaceae bacterium]
MLKLGSLTCALGILAFSAAAPLPAADIYDTISVEEAAVTEALEPAANFAGTPAAGESDSVYTLSSPGCCDGHGGQYCMENPCSDGSDFKVRFVPNGWLFAMHGNTTVRGLTAPVNISMRQNVHLLEHNVHFLFSGKLEIENDEMGLLVNGFYM